MTKLTSSVRNLKKETEPRLKLMSGNLGITLAGIDVVDVPTRSGWVYVRLLNNTSELIQAYNGIVTPIYNLPVLVKRNKDRYELVGRDTLRYQNWGTEPYLPKHGNTHSFDIANGGGSDVVWVHSEQFYPLAPLQSGTSGSNGLLVAPYIYNWFGEWKYAGGVATPEVISYQPTGTSSSKLMLLCLNGNTETFHFIEGDEAPYNATGIVDILPYLPDYNPAVDIPIAAVRIYSGTTSIGWDEIYDVRQFYGREMLTGSSGGGGADNFLDLTDTPNSYAGQGGKFVAVKADVSGLEFVSGTSGGGGGIPEAPIDGTAYGRHNAGWIAVLEDAPVDGLIYGRMNSGWFGFSIPVEEAPIDGKLYGRNTTTWQEISTTGTSGSGGLFWNPALPPTSANAMDDEFDDSSFNTGTWTEMDVSNDMTIVEDEVGLKLTNIAYNEIGSITQPVPAGDYTVWTKLSIYDSTYDGWGRIGICFQQDMDENAIYLVEAQVVGANDHGDVPITAERWQDYANSYNAGSWTKYFPMSVWIRVRVDVSEKTYYTGLSIDGLSWQEAGSDILIWDATRVGLFISQSDEHDTGVFSFFRVTNSIDPAQTMRGNR